MHLSLMQIEQYVPFHSQQDAGEDFKQKTSPKKKKAAAVKDQDVATTAAAAAEQGDGPVTGVAQTRTSALPEDKASAAKATADTSAAVEPEKSTPTKSPKKSKKKQKQQSVTTEVGKQPISFWVLVLTVDALSCYRLSFSATYPYV